MLWYPLVVNKLYPPKPLPPRATNAPSATLTATNATAAPVPAATESTALEEPLVKPIVNTNQPEQLLPVTNGPTRYLFSSYGGGLKEVELLDYPETVSTRLEKETQSKGVATLDRYTPAPTLALIGGEAIQGDGIFTLTPTTNGVRAQKALTNGLTIVKDFEFGTNYMVTATVRLENRSSHPLSLPAQEWVVGTATPMDANDRNVTAIGILWYNGVKSEDIGAAYFSDRGFACTPRIPPAEYRGGSNNVVWVAAHNQFFALAVMPQQPAQAVVMRKVILPRPSGEEARLVATNAAAPQGYEAAMVYPALTLAANQVSETQIHLFAGPKEYQTLARLSALFNNNIDLVMGYSGFSGFFAKGLLLAMNFLHNSLALSYGWAVVAITVIIKLIFWPLTRAGTRSMKRMQALQPQMNAIKEKYKDDPVKMNRKNMEFMKEHKVNPMGGCLPMLIQIPVFFGFYSMIRSAIELRGAHWLWVQDLSKPDILFVIPGLGFVPFFGIPGVGLPFNLLPLIMGVTMLWQARLTPPSPGMDPSQAKMMRYMPLIFMLGLYNFSSGLTLYWTVNNLLTIAQTKLTPINPEPAHAPVLTPPQKKRQ